MPASTFPSNSAQPPFPGELGGFLAYGVSSGDSITLHPDVRWRGSESTATLLREANARIAALERGRIVLIATLAAFPLMLIVLLVMALSRPLALPGPSLSLAAAVIGSLLTGALVFLGASAAAALMSPTPDPAASAS